MKHLLENQEFRLNEILFENRNKQYGAYVLRNESDRILTKALFVGVSLLAAISLTPMLISAFSSETSVHIPTDGPPVVIKLDRVDRPDNPPVKIEPVKATPPPSVKQYNAAVVTPTRDADESNIVKDIPRDAIAGVKNDFIAPPATNTYVQPPTISGTGPVIKTVQPPVIEVPKDPNAIEVAAVQANFEGGIDAFRNKVINKFDGSGFVDEGTLSTIITFIVETNGTISDIKTNGKDASFNAEAIRTIKAVKGKWIPGKNKDGEAVRSYFKFPISMKFD